MFKREKGQSMVEVALTMQLLLLILMGILDLGRAYFTFVALSDAAAEGASYAAIHPTNLTEISARAADSSDGLVTFAPEMVSVEFDGDAIDSSVVTVTVQYDYPLLTPVIQSMVPNGVINMRAVVAQPIIMNNQ